MGRISLRSLTLLEKVSYHYLATYLDLANTDAIFVISVELSVRPDLIRQLVPSHCEAELRSRSIELDNFVPIPLEQMKISLD